MDANTQLPEARRSCISGILAIVPAAAPRSERHMVMTPMSMTMTIITGPMRPSMLTRLLSPSMTVAQASTPTAMAPAMRDMPKCCSTAAPAAATITIKQRYMDTEVK